MEKTPLSAPSNFIRDIIDDDLKNKKITGQVVTRFPPEPNGYLHIGHAKSICLNFGIARDYKGRCHLRFDDTNPAKEEMEYIESIQEDVRWLGFDWGKNLFYASDYYDKLFDYAVQLIKMGKAYVDSLTADQLREHRGTLTEAGKESPYRNRSVDENLDLFQKMRAGGFPDGSHVLRARIDMSSPNINLRDPVLYRILRAEHPRTGSKWCVYPMYDYAHPISDAIEGITHSICTLEFEDHRPLYNWCLETLGIKPHPQQIEFARLNLNYTVMSKRKLMELVTGGLVDGWDDPRMPTICGLRRRGYTPGAIRSFADHIGVAKANSTVDMSLLEYCLREDLNQTSPRAMAVLQPLKVVIDNYPQGKAEELDAENNPEDPGAGVRKVPFSGEIYIERGDFLENPPNKKFFRLSPGAEVRLKNAYYITCKKVVKDAGGNITELHCDYDPQSRGGETADKRMVKGTLHWVSAAHSVKAEVRLYDSLFTVPNPGEGGADYKTQLNPGSLTVLKDCMVEPMLAKAAPGSRWQFLRQGYFCADAKAAKEGGLVFNRTVTLKDTWAKISGQK